MTYLSIDGAVVPRAHGSEPGFNLAPLFFLILSGTALVSGACAPNTRNIETAPGATYEIVSDYTAKHSRGGGQSYNLLPRERVVCEKKAAAGDIVAAKTLMEYYEMVVVDKKQYEHWRRVVERLQKEWLQKERKQRS